MASLKLKSRGILRLSGSDIMGFLQGLITNDISKCTPEKPLYAALLTPQGKYLFDFFILQNDDGYFFDVEVARMQELLKQLMFYKLRAHIVIEDASDQFNVWAFWAHLPEGLIVNKKHTDWSVYIDPRYEQMGWRAILPKSLEMVEDTTFEDYEERRLTFGLPDASRDIEIDKRFILEANFRELNGVDFEKGCYVGQEMTARMNYRGSLKKRLLPVMVAGSVPTPGTEILCNDKNAGHILSGQGERAIALIGLAHLNAPLKTANGQDVQVHMPPWLREI